MSHSSNSLAMAVLRASITSIEACMQIDLKSVMFAVSYCCDRFRVGCHDVFFGTSV